MKMKSLRCLVATRNFIRDYANTEQGERNTVAILTALFVVGVADVLLLIVGEVLS